MPEPTYDYLDYDGLALYDEKIKQVIGGKVDKENGKVLSSNDYTSAEKTKLAGAAPLASPALTGTPTAPTATAGTKTTQVATTAFVDTAITNAIAGIQGITYEVVQTLPSTGEAGVIYLVPNSGSGQNIYDEYIWMGTAFEKIGSTDVDLSGYQPLMTAITNAQINALFS